VISEMVMMNSNCNDKKLIARLLIFGFIFFMTDTFWTI
jgi:hypothetical protein